MLLRLVSMCWVFTVFVWLREVDCDVTELVIFERDVEVKFYDLRKDGDGAATLVVDERAKPHNKTDKKKKRLPCSCQGFTCGCCAGMNVVTLNFNRRACMNITYDPEEFALSTNMLMNDKSIYKNKVSAKNPKPVCLPMPIPFVPVRFDFCAKFFNIFTPGKNLHICMDFEARIMRRPVVVLHFDCLRLGANGIAHVKPEDGGGLNGEGGSGEVGGDGEAGEEGEEGGDVDEVGETGGDEGIGGGSTGTGDTGATGPEPPIEEDYDEITEEKNRYNNTIRRE